MAVVFGLTFYRGQDHLNDLRDRSMLADEMHGELEQLRAVSQRIRATRANRIRKEGYARLEALDAGRLALDSGLADPALSETLDDIGRRLVQTRVHYMTLDGLSVPSLRRVDLPQVDEVELRLRHEIDALARLLRDLHLSSHATAVAYGDALLRMEFWLIAGTALLVLLLTYPTLNRIGTALHALGQGTREAGPEGLPPELSLSGRDEFGQLAHDFNQMARRLAAAEEAREQRAQELETAVKDLENFSYSVSHDLRAPLRAIDGFIGILREDYAPRLDAEGLRLFGVVSANAKKMERLIDDILALSRAGRLEMEWVGVDMNRLVDEVWDNLSEHRQGRAIQFEHADLPTSICDPRAIRQVWQNLLDNAIKFTRGRDPALIEVKAERNATMIRYTVRDNGAGFDPAYSNKLFGLFLRLHGMDEFEGTGVGLAIAQRFVQKHHGEVWGTGAVNAGATFGFSLPIQPAT
ncbi:sensor histidine kinase [Thiocystis violacea]|uniref:sensor histidine kinase n=1 Tax=Thiocystis violacea TaxID=13725 RepID=UPI001F5B5204|nr:ATP-binding protein [Thiocystis violacea]